MEAIVSTKKSVKFQMSENPALSGIVEGEGEKTKRMDEIIEEFGILDIDILSVDVEGHELEALQSMGTHRPRFIIVEFITPGREHNDKALVKFLTDYEVVKSTQANLIFELKE